MTLSSARSVSWKVRTRTVSSLATWRNGVVSVRNVTSTWYWATKSAPSRRKLKAWLASDSPKTTSVESGEASARWRTEAMNGSGGPATSRPIERYRPTGANNLGTGLAGWGGGG